jgi:sulfur-carrier protein adenylyltransferase/sulfurtransferase
LVDQEKLKSANVLVVGTGGLGCPVLINLAAAGVGKITIVDYDKISISNIHRQTLFSPNLVGERKAIIAKKRVLEQNPFVKVEAIVSSVKLSHIKQANIVVDCSDNMETKYFLHDACFKLRIPLVSASVYKNEGQVRTFLPGQDYGCLRCHVVETPDDSLIGNCNDFGVLGAATSVIGSIQASEIIQLIQTGINNTTKKTFFFNLSNLNQLAVKNTSNPSCATCDGEIELIETDMEVDEVLEGSIFVDIRDKSDEELKEYFNQTQKVILCCHKGVRSKKLVKQFREQGGSHFFSFKGGACSL